MNTLKRKVFEFKSENGVKFLIDGREVPLDSKDLALQLKGMQSSEI